MTRPFPLACAFGLLAACTLASPTQPHPNPQRETEPQPHSQPDPQPDPQPKPKPEPDPQPTATELTLAQAATIFATLDTPLHHQAPSDWEATSTLLGSGDTQTLCVRPPNAPWERCLEADWRKRDNLALSGGDDGEPICIKWGPRKRRRGWSVPGPDGELKAGCKDAFSKTGKPKGSAPKAGALPFDAVELGPVAVIPAGDDAAILRISDEDEYEQLDQLCLRDNAAAHCETPRLEDTGMTMEVTYDQLHRDPSGPWVSVVRTRIGTGGAEERRGDLSVLLFHRDSAGLALHGVLPVGGYNGERFGESYDDGFSWEMVEVESTVRLASGGCLEVKSAAKRDTWPDRKGNWASKPIAVAAADPTADGADRGVYEFDVERDFSGAWMPKAGGGFERVPSCGTAR